MFHPIVHDPGQVFLLNISDPIPAPRCLAPSEVITIPVPSRISVAFSRNASSTIRTVLREFGKHP